MSTFRFVVDQKFDGRAQFDVEPLFAEIVELPTHAAAIAHKNDLEEQFPEHGAVWVIQQ